MVKTFKEDGALAYVFLAFCVLLLETIFLTLTYFFSKNRGFDDLFSWNLDLVNNKAQYVMHEINGAGSVNPLMQMLQNFKNVSANFETFIEELQLLWGHWYGIISLHLYLLLQSNINGCCFFFKKKFLWSSEKWKVFSFQLGEMRFENLRKSENPSSKTIYLLKLFI